MWRVRGTERGRGRGGGDRRIEQPAEKRFSITVQLTEYSFGYILGYKACTKIWIEATSGARLLADGKKMYFKAQGTKEQCHLAHFIINTIIEQRIRRNKEVPNDWETLRKKYSMLLYNVKGDVRNNKMVSSPTEIRDLQVRNRVYFMFDPSEPSKDRTVGILFKGPEFVGRALKAVEDLNKLLDFHGGYNGLCEEDQLKWGHYMSSKRGDDDDGGGGDDRQNRQNNERQGGSEIISSSRSRSRSRSRIRKRVKRD